MTYTVLEQRVGDFLQEIGTKPSGDWARWTQARRRAAIAWAEKLAARYLPDDEKSSLIVDYTVSGSIVTAYSAGPPVVAGKSTILFAGYGPRVMKVRNLSATVDSRRKDFNFLENADERMLANLNRLYGYWWTWRSGLPTIYHPIALASVTPIVMEALNNPPSCTDLYFYYTQATPANVISAVGDVITGTSSGAIGTVTEYGSSGTTTHWVRYTLTSGTFLSTEAFTTTGLKSGTIYHASSAFGADLSPFLGNEENVAKGAAGYLLQQAGDRRAGLYLPGFYSWLKVTEQQAQDGK